MSNTKYYAAELMVYFEKHKFLDVLRALMIQLALDRPLCVKHYLRTKLRSIANSVLTKNTIVHLPLQFDVEHFVKICLQKYNIPTITYNTKGTILGGNKLNKILAKFEKFCKKNGLRKKHKIYLNFPTNIDEVLQIENCVSPPTNFIHVFNEDDMDLDFKDVLDYYGCIVKKVSTTKQDNTPSIVDTVVAEVMHKIKFSPQQGLPNISDHFVYRAVIMGRRGSGRKTQAKMLAIRYNWVYINIESLIEQTMQSQDNMAKVLCVAFNKEKKFTSTAITALLWKRLLQNDSLARGWVIVGFPNCLNELEILMEKFETPPNRIVVIHCSKTIALRRLIKQWERSNDPNMNRVNTCTKVEEEYAQYDRCKLAMYDYLKASKGKTIHIDGTSDICGIKNKIFALLHS